MTSKKDDPKQKNARQAVSGTPPIVTEPEMELDFDRLSAAEMRVIEELFMQGITGKPASVSRRVASGLIAKGFVEEALFVTGYTPAGAKSKSAFRLSAMGQFRYCLWYEKNRGSQ